MGNKKRNFAYLSVLSALVAVTAAVILFLWLPKRNLVNEFKNQLDQMEKVGAPNFQAKTLEGNSFNLFNLKGKIVIVNFWATWCGPCVEEIPSLIRLSKQMKNKIELVFVSEDSDLKEVTSFLKAFPDIKQENIKMIWDSDRAIMKLYGSERLPESFIFNKDFKLAKKIIGSINWSTEDALSYLSDLDKK